MNVTDLISILNSSRSDGDKLEAIINFSRTPIKEKKVYEYLANSVSSLLPLLWDDVIRGGGRNSSPVKRLRLIHEKVFVTAENLHTTGFLCPFLDAFETYFPEVENKIKRPENIGIREKDVRRITYPEKYTYLLSKFDGRKQDLSLMQGAVHVPA